MRAMKGSWSLLVLLLLSPIPAQAGEGTVLYRLATGSTLLDDCLICGRPSIELPIEGTFLLTLEAIGDVTDWYRVDALDFRTTEDASYQGNGSGSYLTRLGQGGVVEIQSLFLEVEINNEAGLRLESGEVKVEAGLPAFDIQAMEATQSQMRVFTLHLLAQPVEGVAYEVLPECYFADDCNDCKRVLIPRPLVGGFNLALVDENPLFATYRLYGLDLRNAEAAVQIGIQGWGTYSIGGEVALLQGMDLELGFTVDGSTRSPVPLASGGKVGMLDRRFPEIGIQLREKDPPDPLHIYTIRLVARPVPVGPAPFRRGDSNGDGRIDLSDAVHALFHIYLGGSEPDCLEATDMDGTGAIDLTDPIFLLTYLFLAGKEPPEPGLATCGQAPKPLLGCGSYGACGAGAAGL